MKLWSLGTSVFILFVLGFAYISNENINGDDLFYSRMQYELEGYHGYSSEKAEEEIYNVERSQIVAEQLKWQTSKEHYSIENPYFVRNPFGTNECSFYLAFQTDEPTYLEYTIKAQGLPDFTRRLKSDNNGAGTTKHEYQLIGFVPNVTNNLVLRLYTENGRLYRKQVIRGITFQAKDEVQSTIEFKDGNSSMPLSEGLYAMFTSNTKANEEGSDILCYDNEGVLRSVYPVKNYRAVRMIPVGNHILYAINARNIVMISPLGQVMKNYSLGKYSYHHDYQYDKATNALYLLATDRTNPNHYIEDIVIKLDLSTGQVTEVIDFKDLFSDYYGIAKPANDEDPGDFESIDWIHMNSLTLKDSADEMIFSSREFSAIVKVTNVLSEPRIQYLIGDKFVLDGFDGEKYYLKKDKKNGDFLYQYGQHDVVYVKDEQLDSDSYYLTMFNNNAGWAHSRDDLDWSHLTKVGKGLMPSKDNPVTSYYYKYLVNEREKSFSLVESFPVPYSGIVSNAGYYKDNIMVSSGTDCSFGEYDTEGNLIREYKTGRKNFTYRVYKYDFL